MATDNGASKAPPVIERFVRQLVVTNKAVQLYPVGSDIPHQNATTAVAALRDALEEYSEVTLAITKQGLYFDVAPIFPGQPTFLALSQELYNRRLALVRFHAGVETHDIIGFLTVLKSTPDEVTAAGGFEAMMWEQGIGTITVIETQVTLVDQSAEANEGDEGDSTEPTATTTAVQVRSNVPRTRERIELARVSGDHGAIKDYLTQHVDADGNELTLGQINKRFSELAHMAAETPGPTADDFIRAFASALWAVAPELRQELLDKELLPEARNDDALANAVRRIDLEEVMRMLAVPDDEEDARRTGFTRALRNLAMISNIDREHVASAAGNVMREVGASQQTIDFVVSEAVPTKLTVRRAPTSTRPLDSAASMVLQLIDHAPLSRLADGSVDPEVAALQQEAVAGITEGDIIAALVALAGMESAEQPFANTMSTLEDSLDVLVAKGEIETAADAAISLVHAAKNPELSAQQTRRLENAITRFSRPEDIREITHTLRIFEPGQPEYDAAQKLLDTLGVLAIRPLLEQLAEEQDRSERKGLVDLISRSAVRYISELGVHINDPRWYFVRNVVAILGSTKSPDAINPLERTLRHPEPRVRRESIRALSMVQDHRAIDLLIGALDDEDGHNVQLAARYLGLKNARNAVPSLEALARGEGRGNRENGPRVEAIEALGRMGARDALPTLEGLSRKRALIGAARVRELRTAASAAIAAIHAKGGA
jgi:HEAT repeat protein